MRRRRQFGLATVELAITSATFMVIMLGAIEMSRMLFTWNTLDAITQRAARVAAVCPFGDPQVPRVAAFQSPTGGDSLPLLPSLTAANIQIEYLTGAFTAAADNASTQYVRASIQNYQHTLAIPFLSNTTVTSPPFATTLPAESLGFIPFDGVRDCF